MCDHTYCYTPAVSYIRELIHTGVLGDLHYFDSVRINLGLVQPDIDVMWDLAPHDLSILDSVLPQGVEVVAVAAHGADPIGAGRACVAYLTLRLNTGGDRPHPRQLALPDQGAHHHGRRLQADRGVGRPEPGPSGSRSSTAQGR